MALTLDDIKTHLKIEVSDASTDAELSRMHDAALEMASAFLNRPIPWTVIDAVTLVETEVYPKSVEQAVLILIADLYEHREKHVIGMSVAALPSVYNLLWPHRTGLGA